MTTPLHDEFKTAQQHINLNSRERVAIAAHLEVRAVLSASAALVGRGLDDVLIGSYPRHVTIWPGRDVDVFGKLTAETIDSISPAAAYQLFLDVLTAAFGGRVEPQPRSVKVKYVGGFLPDLGFIRKAAELLGEEKSGQGEAFDFSVDVVPAVRSGDVWAIPQSDPERWRRMAAAERWVRTDPEQLTSLTQQMNGGLKIDGQGAYVPTVKAVRQIRSWYLGKVKPGGLFFELIVYEGFDTGQITGSSWAEVTASALAYVAARLPTITVRPVCDPAMGQAYAPAPEPAALAQAALSFGGFAADAQRALTLDACPAAALWRRVFGENTHANGPVFPLPKNCREDGTIMPATVAANPLRGTNEARGFGER